MADYDAKVWRAIGPTTATGTPRVKRRYQFSGAARNGQSANMTIELVMAHPTCPGVYSAREVFAHNCGVLPDWINLDDCTPA